jgi:hypothetical protein
MFSARMSEEFRPKNFLSLRALWKLIINPKFGNYYISLAKFHQLVKEGIIAPDYILPSGKKFCFSRSKAYEIVDKFKHREIDPFKLKAREKKILSAERAGS